MSKAYIVIFPVLGLILLLPHRAPAADANWKLVWADEFSGTALDPNKWSCDEGNGFYIGHINLFIRGWGNNELECYTDRPENVYVKDGLLHIRAVKESYYGCRYTSARLLTRDHFSKLYGRFEFKAKLPVGKGMWPAIWLLPADKTYGTWPASGEIDIAEARGQQPTRVLGTLHFGSTGSGHDWQEDDFEFPQGQNVNDFHVYALEWEPGVIRYYIDDTLYATKRWWWSSSQPDNGGHHNRPDASTLNAWPAPFDKPFYILMNLAVGGNFLGDPDSKTVFPQEMLVQYVRMYDRVGGYGPLQPPAPQAPPDPAPAQK
jgi:beta-glucanase (GH16 family)